MKPLRFSGRHVRIRADGIHITHQSTAYTPSATAPVSMATFAHLSSRDDA
jgi:hypothetical protein